MPAQALPPVGSPAAGRRGDWVALCLILLLALALRLPALGHAGYSFDEYWKAELACGRGSAHLRLPVDVVMQPVDLFDLRQAAPWWRVWSTMECTHPPLYYLLLRFWMDAFGQGDATERAFAAVTSVLAIAFLFDAAKLLHGRSVAVWACVLMAVAGPQVEHARLTSNYALELATVLAAADALVRTEVLGATTRRTTALSAAILAALLTHYFCVGVLAGLGAYGVLRLRGRARQHVVAAFAAAGVAFLICWGPFMWQQRHLFATDDPATVFLQDARAGHARRVLWAAVNVPCEMLARLPERFAAAGSVLGLLYVLPFALLRRRPALLLWALCLLGSVGLIVGLDLARQTRQVDYLRYLIVAGPAVYVLIPALASHVSQRWLRHGLPSAALVLCGAFVWQAYHPWTTDGEQVAADVRAVTGPADLFILLGVGHDQWTAPITYLMLTRYLRPFPTQLVIEHGPPGPAVRERARRSRQVVAFPYTADPRGYLGNMKLVGGQKYPGPFTVWVLTPTRDTTRDAPRP